MSGRVRHRPRFSHIHVDRPQILPNGVAPADQIAIAQLDRINPECRGDPVHLRFSRPHRLRPANGTEGGARHGVGIGRLRGQKLKPKRLVELATIEGARLLGIAEKTGSLTPGKRADLITVRANDINMAPLGDPFYAIVFFGQPSNVDTVMADGRILVRNGKAHCSRCRKNGT